MQPVLGQRNGRGFSKGLPQEKNKDSVGLACIEGSVGNMIDSDLAIAESGRETFLLELEESFS